MRFFVWGVIDVKNPTLLVIIHIPHTQKWAAGTVWYGFYFLWAQLLGWRVGKGFLEEIFIYSIFLYIHRWLYVVITTKSNTSV